MISRFVRLSGSNDLPCSASGSLLPWAQPARNAARPCAFVSSSQEGGEQSHGGRMGASGQVSPDFCAMESADSKFEGTEPVALGAQIALHPLGVAIPETGR